VGHVLLRCRKYRDLRRRELGGGGRIDLRAIMNEPKLVTRAIRFMELTHILGQFRSCGAAQTDEVERWGRLKIWRHEMARRVHQPTAQITQPPNQKIAILIIP
jgi:hypothetical protein